MSVLHITYTNFKQKKKLPQVNPRGIKVIPRLLFV